SLGSVDGQPEHPTGALDVFRGDVQAGDAALVGVALEDAAGLDEVGDALDGHAGDAVEDVDGGGALALAADAVVAGEAAGARSRDDVDAGLAQGLLLGAEIGLAGRAVPLEHALVRLLVDHATGEGVVGVAQVLDERDVVDAQVAVEI